MTESQPGSFPANVRDLIALEPTAESFTAAREEIQRRGKEIVLGAPQLFIDVDVEADGIPGFGSMLSLGAQSPTGESFYREIQPISNDIIPIQSEFATRHGLPRDHLYRSAPDFKVVMADFYDWLSTLTQENNKTPVCTVFNPALDWGFIALYFKLAGYDRNPLGLAPCDLKSLILPLVDWDWNKTQRNQLPPIIRPERAATHNSLEDAKDQQEIHFRIAGLLGKPDYLHLTT